LKAHYAQTELFILCCCFRLDGSPVLSGLRRLSYFLGAARTADLLGIADFLLLAEGLFEAFGDRGVLGGGGGYKGRHKKKTI
jgi:hypothetical protein